jgi:hypothetical protein
MLMAAQSSEVAPARASGTNGLCRLSAGAIAPALEPPKSRTFVIL